MKFAEEFCENSSLCTASCWELSGVVKSLSLREFCFPFFGMRFG